MEFYVMFISEFGTTAGALTVDVGRCGLATASIHMLACPGTAVNTQVFPTVRTDLIIRGLDHDYKTFL